MPVRFQAAIAVLILTMLPQPGSPAAERAEPFARALLESLEPAELEARLIAEPDQIPTVLRNLGSALMTEDAALRTRLESYLPRLAHAHAQRVAPHFSEGDLRILVSLQLVDPQRFQQDAAFRARVAPLLPRTLDRAMPETMRTRCLEELNGAVGIDFETAENIAVAWGLVRRASAARRVAFDATTLRMPDDVRGPIAASIYSIDSRFFPPAEARAFLAAVRAASPKRRIVVLGDAAIRDAARDLAIELVDARAREYSPWPRDPFIVARDAGGVVFVNRPNLQPEREEDANMVRALLQNLPDDATWGDARWTVAPVPFHNGHILLMPETAWISIHTVEIRALEILGLPRVPVEWFTKADGAERYLAAVRAAAKELEGIYRRPVRFVHPLSSDPERMSRLAGGAGFDLDSLVAILPTGGKPQALVGDLALGAGIARKADWSAARAAYGLQGGNGATIAKAQTSPRNAALQGFLDTVAQHLAASGMTVRRLPLINIPQSMVENGRSDVPLTWTNVVLEGNRAEGFASLLADGDAVATRTFEAAGRRLVLFPPLARSVVLNGGYRCASNHLR